MAGPALTAPTAPGTSSRAPRAPTAVGAGRAACPAPAMARLRRLRRGRRRRRRCCRRRRRRSSSSSWHWGSSSSGASSSAGRRSRGCRSKWRTPCSRLHRRCRRCRCSGREARAACCARALSAPRWRCRLRPAPRLPLRLRLTRPCWRPWPRSAPWHPAAAAWCWRCRPQAASTARSAQPRLPQPPHQQRQQQRRWQRQQRQQEQQPPTLQRRHRRCSRPLRHPLGHHPRRRACPAPPAAKLGWLHPPTLLCRSRPLAVAGGWCAAVGCSMPDTRSRWRAGDLLQLVARGPHRKPLAQLGPSSDAALPALPAAIRAPYLCSHAATPGQSQSRQVALELISRLRSLRQQQQQRASGTAPAAVERVQPWLAPEAAAAAAEPVALLPLAGGAAWEQRRMTGAEYCYMLGLLGGQLEAVMQAPTPAPLVPRGRPAAG